MGVSRGAHAALGCTLIGGCGLAWRSFRQGPAFAAAALPVRAVVVDSAGPRFAKLRDRAARGALPSRAARPRGAGLAARAAEKVPPAVALGGVALGGIAAGRRRRQPRRTGGLVALGASAGADDEVIRDLGAKDEVRRDLQASGEVAATKEDRGPWGNLSPDVQEDIKVFFSSLAVALAIRGVIVEPRFIPSESMVPTFQIGDQLTVDKFSTRLGRIYQRHDVVVFYPPPAFWEVKNKMAPGGQPDLFQSILDNIGVTARSEALIKRVVAVAGDKVKIQSGILYINGEAQDEPFINERPKYDMPTITVPPENVFVLGDNRNASLDGHIWGFLPVDNIIGRATWKFWPPWHFGGVEGTPS